MKKSALRVGLVLPFVVCGVAVAAGHRHKAGSEAFTEPSGAKGSANVELLVTREFYGVQAIKLWDFDRRTCQLQIEQGSLNAPGTGVLEPVKVCEPESTQSWKRADVGQGQLVTAVAVCTAKSKALPIRGLQIWGAAIDAGGKLVPAKRPAKIEFSGCEKWWPKSACPTGTVATGVRAFTDTASGAVGLGLRCHGIETIP